VRKHPSFDDFAWTEKGLWNLEKDENLKRRFRPLPLAGMMSFGLQY